MIDVFTSSDLEMKKISNVILKFCPFVLKSTSEDIARSLVKLYDEVNEVWDDRYTELPDDTMIWTEILQQKPNLNTTRSHLKLRRTEIFDDERADDECLIIVSFFTNFVRLSSKENYLMTRLSMEHTAWLRNDISLVLQLENRLRSAILKERYDMCVLDENVMWQVKEFFLFGHRLSVEIDWHANARIFSSLADHSQTLSIDIEIESACLHKAIGKEDLRKITGCLKSKDDLIVVDQSAYVKRTSDFFPAYYWMSLYYKITEQPGTRLFGFNAENFKKNLITFQMLLMHVSSEMAKRGEQHRNPYLKLKCTILYNVFTTYGRYLGEKEDYLSVKSNIIALFYK